MALDPSISLGVKQPEGFDISKYAALGNALTQRQLMQQQIEASKTGQALTEQQTANAAAQNPGIVADSSMKARIAAFQKWQTDNTDKYMVDGKPDINRFVNEAAKSGYFTEAQGVAGTDLSNRAQAIANASNEQNAAIARSDYTQSLLGHVATLLSAAPPGARAGLLKQYGDYANKQVPGAGDQLFQAMGTTDAKTGLPVIDAKRVDAIKEATMTPLQKENLAVAQKNANTAVEGVIQSGVTNMSGPQARDPNSALSKNAVDFGTKAGIPGVKPGMSAAELANLPGFKEAFTASVIPAATKAAGIADSTQSLKNSNTYGTAASLVDKLIGQGKLPPGVKLSTWLSANFAKLGNDPDVRALQAALNDISTVNPSINLDVGSSSLAAQLKTEQMKALRNSRASGEIAKGTTFNTLQSNIEKQATPPAEAPGPGKASDLIPMVDAQGKRHNVHKSRLEDAKAAGLKPISGGQ